MSIQRYNSLHCLLTFCCSVGFVRLANIFGLELWKLRSLKVGGRGSLNHLNYPQYRVNMQCRVCCVGSGWWWANRAFIAVIVRWKTVVWRRQRRYGVTSENVLRSRRCSS